MYSFIMFGSDLCFIPLTDLKISILGCACVARYHWFNSSVCCRKTNIYPSIYTRNMYISNTPFTLSFQVEYHKLAIFLVLRQAPSKLSRSRVAREGRTNISPLDVAENHMRARRVLLYHGRITLSGITRPVCPSIKPV